MWLAMWDTSPLCGNAKIAPMVEREFEELCVGGSTPSLGTELHVRSLVLDIKPEWRKFGRRAGLRSQ